MEYQMKIHRGQPDDEAKLHNYFRKGIEKMDKQINRIGEVNLNNEKCLMKIVEYENCDAVIVEFQDEFKAKVHTAYKCFKNGGIKNPYYKSVCGVGYIGNGKYKAKINNNTTIQYNTWNHMIQRVYDKKTHGKHPTYSSCAVSEEWHDFQNFAECFDENHYSIDGEEMAIDKDILKKGNKIYSPKKCVFAPQRINNLFLKRQNARGDYPVGVYFHKPSNTYRTYLQVNGKQQHLGYYNTPEEAFRIYKQTKENYIKKVADEYKGKIPQNLYDAMVEYKVGIDD